MTRLRRLGYLVAGLYRMAAGRHVWCGRLPYRLIEAGADVRARDRSGHTALMWAATTGDAKLVRTLLARGADPLARDTDGHTALDRAEGLGLEEVARLLRHSMNARRPNHRDNVCRSNFGSTLKTPGAAKATRTGAADSSGGPAGRV